MRRRRPAPDDLRVRLERLHDLVDWLLLHAELGAQLRCELTALGSPTWSSAEDLSFRRWIAVRGDERARQLLALLDGEIAQRMAACEAGKVGDRGEIEPS